MSKLKTFWNYVIPSIMGMTIISLYFIADGIFVGRGIGPNGLAAVNIASPFMAIITAANMMITMGGATIMSISYGKGKIKEGNDAFMISSILSILMAFTTITLVSIFANQIVGIMGANKEVSESAVIYLRYFIAFGFFLLYSQTIGVFIRNDGNPKLVFYATITGALLNVVLDYTFIFPMQMGIKGAAIASGLGQTVSLIILMFHFVKKKGHLKIYLPKISFHKIIDIIKTGSPEFIVEMSFPICILAYNFVLLRLYNDLYVAAFSIIIYVVWVLRSVFSGISQGSQPLIGMAYGKGDQHEVHYYFRLAITTGIVISLAATGLFFAFGQQIASIFTPDAHLIELTVHGLKIYSLSFIFTAVNTIAIMYLQSIKATRYANLISVNRGLTINLLVILGLPMLFGREIVWYTITIAEVTAMIFAIICVHYRNKQIENH